MGRECGMAAWICDSCNWGALVLYWASACHFLEGSRPLGRDAAWLHGSVIAVIRVPWLRLGVMSVVSSGLAYLSTAQNALDIGTPRALPVLAREDWRGLSLRPDGPPDSAATGDMTWGRGCVILLKDTHESGSSRLFAVVSGMVAWNHESFFRYPLPFLKTRHQVYQQICLI